MTTEVIASRYRVLKKLGEGGMGLVHLVEDTTTQQQVALKVLTSRLGSSDQAALQFKQEFRQMAALRHPNCCAVYDYGQLPDGSPFLTMEVVPGHGLDEILPVDNDTFRSIFSQLLQALGYIHQLGFVHCDIKDENARIRPDGAVRLMDFGLMERAGRASGAIKGTLGYMSPEMARGGRLDQRADLYALGCLGYQMLTGRLPFPGNDPVALIQAHLNQIPEAPSTLHAGIDPTVERVILRLMEKEPLARYQSADEVLEDLGIEVAEDNKGTLLTAPFVGRDDELSTLGRKLQALTQGHPGGAILVTGAAGAGKSRLTEEFRFTVQMQNLPFVVGSSHEQGTAPYGPFVEALRALLPTVRERGTDLLAKYAPILVKLLPELVSEPGLPEFTPAADLDPAPKEKMRLQGTLSEFLGELSRRKPLVTVLEDWHWADDLSAELLTYILRNNHEAPLLFVLNYRGLPSETNAWLTMTERLELPGLTSNTVERMVAAMLGSEIIGENFLQQIVSFADGNPFFVEGLLGHLVRNGTLVKTKGRWNSDVTLTPDQMPANLQGMVLEKLAALSSSALEVAQIAATVGRELTLDIILGVTRLEENALFDALSELSEHAIVVQTEDGAYRFSQGQLQEILYANLDAETKQRLHAAVADALEMSAANTHLDSAPMVLVTALAHHAIQAGMKEKTVTYALAAGSRSARLFANNDAHRFLSAGLEYLTDDAASQASSTEEFWRTKLAYLGTLGDVCRVSGRTEEAKVVYEQAIPLAEKLRENQQLGRMLTSAAKVSQMGNDYPTALDLTRRSLEVCLTQEDFAGAARCLLTSGRINYFVGKLTEAGEQIHQALEMARSADEPAYLGEALGFLGLMYVSGDPDKLSEGEENLKQSVEILAELGDRVGLSNSYNLLGNSQNMQGNFEAAWDTFQLNKKICIEIGMRDEEIFASLNLAITAFELGRFQDAAQLAAEANALATKMNAKFPLGMAYTLEAASRTFLGDVEKGLDLVQAALELAREIKNTYVEALVLQYQLEIQLHMGLLNEACTTGETLTALIKETGNSEPESRMQALYGEVLVRLGETETGAKLVEQALASAQKAHAKGIQGRAMRALAWCRMRQGRLEEAQHIATTALAITNKIGARFQSLQVLLLQGELAIRQGNLAVAAEVFETAKRSAENQANPLMRALALHGLASAHPYQRTSKQQLIEAQRTLRRLLETLEPDAKETFLSLPERQRVVTLSPISSEAIAGAEASPQGPLGDRLQRLGRDLLELAAQASASQADTLALEEDLTRLSRVLDFAEMLSEVRDPEQALARGLETIMTETRADRGFLVIDAASCKGQVLRAIRPDGGYQADWELARRLVEEAREKGTAVCVRDAHEDPRTHHAVKAHKLSVQTALAVPVRLSGEVVGEMYLDRETSDGYLFEEADTSFVSRLANQAGIAFRNATAAAQMEQRSRQLEMLNQLAEKINETLVVEEVLDLVVQLTLEVTHAERGFLMLLEGNTNPQLVCKAAYETNGRSLTDERISMSICDKVLTSGQAVTVVDATTDQEFQAAQSIMSLNLRTLMCVPLQAKGKTLGVLYVDSQAVVTTFTERDLDLLKAIAGHSSGAIENAMLYTSLNQRAEELEKALAMYRQAEHEASTDVLTGLHNRRFFQDQSAREIELSKRQYRNMAVIMLDVDHFKKFNDTYGHAIGDEVLKIVGRILPETVRASDIPCRFGGEEFVILCPDTDGPGAAIVADRIREAISQVELVDLEGKPVRQITASLGVAALIPTDQRVAELLERADTALYACKAGGRNQVQIWRDGMLTPEELKKKEQAEIEQQARAAAGSSQENR